MSNWESHHASIQQANGDPQQTPYDFIQPETLAGRRGIPQREDLGDLDHPIEPAVVGRWREWAIDNGQIDTLADEDEIEERGIGETHTAETDEAINEAGVDALAYYLPITFYGPRRYGIYVRANRFYGFCNRVQKIAPTASWGEVTAESWDFVLRHEAFHAAVELSCLAGDDFMARHKARTYKNYFGLSAQSWPSAHYGAAGPYRCPEEQLAQHAGFSRIAETASGIAITNALIQIFRGAPADYAYDPSEWPSRGPCSQKSKQSQLQRALHSVQLASLLGCRKPASVSDTRPNIEPPAWFPQKGSVDVLEGIYGSVPVRVVDFGRKLPRRFIRACTFRNIDMRKFISAVCRECDVSHDEKGGKHPRLVVGEKRHKVPYPRAARTTPLYVIEEIAELLSTTKEDLLSQCKL